MSHVISVDGGCLGLGQVAESVHQRDLPEGERVGPTASGCQVGLPVFFLWSYSTRFFLSIFTNHSVEQGWSVRDASEHLLQVCISSHCIPRASASLSARLFWSRTSLGSLVRSSLGLK